MKKSVIGICIFILTLLSAFYAYGADAPLENVPFIEDISFKNAHVEGGFVQNSTSFDLVLEDPEKTPAVLDYTVNGSANVFVNYTYDKSNHQTGMQVTLAFDGGSVIYTFNYKNAPQYKITSNAYLAAISCEYGEVQPTISSETTSYKLYIPSDLTAIDITPITEDINAYCASVHIELNERQEPEIKLTVKASDESTRTYRFKVKRINKTVAEVDKEMKEADFVSFVEGARFYEKPQFKVAAASAAGGITVLFVIAVLMKRVIVNPYDRDEKEFYARPDEE